MAARSQASLRRRLRSSQEAQQRQALLVRKLQAKVLQYRTWCRELERHLEARGGCLPGRWESPEDHSLEKALLQVEEEQQRCENLAEVNTLLREHLDKANEVNSALKEDVGKVVADWMRAREELELKESEWRNERELYASYFGGERNSLLSLWRQVETFRRHFLEMKSATDRDLSELKAEQLRVSGSILIHCSRLSSGVQLWQSVTLGRPALKDEAQQQAGREISQKSRDVMCLQVKADLEKKELQDRVMELSALLAQSQKQNEEKEKTIKTLHDTVKRLGQLEEECKTSSSHRQHLQSLVEALRSDCAKLEKNREELQQQLEVTQQEASRLRQSNAELQLRADSAQGEKVEQEQMMERAHRDQELLLKDLAALEGKHSLLQSELVVARETLEESHLQRDLLKQEKRELSVALAKAEQSVAELTALALEKGQLKELVVQLEQENAILSGQVDEMERARISDQEKLTLSQRSNEELSARKAHLEQLLEKAEEQQEELRVELMILAEEKAETQEKLGQVYRRQESARGGLEQLRQESSRQGHALARVSEEKELLVREKAALEVRLAALEQDRQGLSEQLAEARSGKETLESSLFEAQQHLSQLEIARSQLEIQLHTVRQAKEVIQGEVKCLQCELDAERALIKQEQEDMAQQLSRTEQQSNDTLRLRQAGHEAEINRLLQDLASEREGHRSELQEMLEQWEKEKAETEGEHEKELSALRQKVAAMQARQEEERTRAETAKQEQAVAEGEQLSWLLEKRLLSQQLESLQQGVARLELEKTELKQLNAELRRTLEQVERERRRLKRYCRGRSLPDARGFSLPESAQQKMPAARQEESHMCCCSHQLAEMQSQVSLLQTQLARERKYRQDYIQSSAKTSQELSELHQELSSSLAAVVREPKAAVLEAEARKLDRSLNLLFL